MNCARLAAVLVTCAYLASCASTGDKDTLADLRTVQADLKEVKIEGGIEKAIQSYRRFLEETPDSGMTPEAIRRLADLNVQKEYGLTEAAQGTTRAAGKKLNKPKGYDAAAAKHADKADRKEQPATSESVKDFEKRAAASTARSPPGRWHFAGRPPPPAARPCQRRPST